MRVSCPPKYITIIITATHLFALDYTGMALSEENHQAALSTCLSWSTVLTMSERLGGESAVERRERGSPMSSSFTFNKMVDKGASWGRENNTA